MNRVGKDGNIGNPPSPRPHLSVSQFFVSYTCELHQHCGVRVCNLHIVSRNQDSNCSVCSGGFRSHCPLFLRSVFVPGVSAVSWSPFSGTGREAGRHGSCAPPFSLAKVSAADLQGRPLGASPPGTLPHGLWPRVSLRRSRRPVRIFFLL